MALTLADLKARAAGTANVGNATAKPEATPQSGTGNLAGLLASARNKTDKSADIPATQGTNSESPTKSNAALVDSFLSDKPEPVNGGVESNQKTVGDAGPLTQSEDAPSQQSGNLASPTPAPVAKTSLSDLLKKNSARNDEAVVVEPTKGGETKNDLAVVTITQPDLIGNQPQAGQTPAASKPAVDFETASHPSQPDGLQASDVDQLKAKFRALIEHSEHGELAATILQDILIQLRKDKRYSDMLLPEDVGVMTRTIRKTYNIAIAQVAEKKTKRTKKTMDQSEVSMLMQGLSFGGMIPGGLTKKS